MKYVKLILSILISLSAGFIGSFFTPGSWYSELNKPFFNPPGFVFGPVWTVLYILMGVALYLVWQAKDNKAMFVFGVQLVLNALWSILFFGLQNVFLAMLEIIVLWASIIVTMFFFFRVNKAAGYLLVPYLLWVSFAAVLNFSIWVLN